MVQKMCTMGKCEDDDKHKEPMQSDIHSTEDERLHKKKEDSEGENLLSMDMEEDNDDENKGGD